MTYQILQWLIAGAWLATAAAPQTHGPRFDDTPFAVAGVSAEVTSP